MTVRRSHALGALLTLSLVTLVVLLLTFGCSEPKRFENLNELERDGLAVYRARCVVCHSMNASKSGPLGPDIAGSSSELLKARVLYLKYPPGYQPKRPGSKQMLPAMPFLEDKIDALHAFLDPKHHPDE